MSTIDYIFRYDPKSSAIQRPSADGTAARKALDAAGVALIGGPFLDFRDPWGNRIEIVGYDNIQFTKAPNVLRGMGLTHLAKNERAKKELAEKGMSVGQD